MHPPPAEPEEKPPEEQPIEGSEIQNNKTEAALSAAEVSAPVAEETEAPAVVLSYVDWVVFEITGSTADDKPKTLTFNLTRSAPCIPSPQPAANKTTADSEGVGVGEAASESGLRRRRRTLLTEPGAHARAEAEQLHRNQERRTKTSFLFQNSMKLGELISIPQAEKGSENDGLSTSVAGAMGGRQLESIRDEQDQSHWDHRDTSGQWDRRSGHGEYESYLSYETTSTSYPSHSPSSSFSDPAPSALTRRRREEQTVRDRILQRQLVQVLTEVGR